MVTPERRMAREYSPDKKALEALRAEGFTAANIVPGSRRHPRDRARSCRWLRAIRTWRSSGPTPFSTWRSTRRARRQVRTTTPTRPRGLSRLAHGRDRRGAADVFRCAASGRGSGALRGASERAPAARCSMLRWMPSSRRRGRRCRCSSSRRRCSWWIGRRNCPANSACSRSCSRPGRNGAGRNSRAPRAAPFIVPVDFPEVPKLPEDDDWLAMPFEQLRAWDHAPGNPALLRREGRGHRAHHARSWQRRTASVRTSGSPSPAA